MKYITSFGLQRTIVVFLIFAIDIWVGCFKCAIIGRTPTYSRKTALYVQVPPIIPKAVPWAPNLEVAGVFDILVNGSMQRKAAVLSHVIPIFILYKAITSKFIQKIFKICYRYILSLFQTQKVKKPENQMTKKKEALQLSFEKARIDQPSIFKEIVKTDEKKSGVLIEQKDPLREDAALIGKAKQSVQVILANIDEAKAKASTDGDVKLSYQLKETFKEEMRAVKIARELELQRIEAVAVAEKQKRMDEFRKGQEGRRASLEENMKKKRDEKRESQVADREKAAQEELRNRAMKELEETAQVERTAQNLMEKEKDEGILLEEMNREQAELERVEEEQVELERVEEVARTNETNDLIRREEIRIEEDLLRNEEKIQEEIRSEAIRAQEEIDKSIEEYRIKLEARIVEEERSRDEERMRETGRIQQEEDRLRVLDKIKEDEQKMIQQRSADNEKAAQVQRLKDEAAIKDEEEQEMIKQRTLDNERAALEQRLKEEAILKKEEEQKMIKQRTADNEKVALRLKEEAILKEAEEQEMIKQRTLDNERAALEQKLKEEAMLREEEEQKMIKQRTADNEAIINSAEVERERRRLVEEKEIKESLRLLAEKREDELGKGGKKQRVKEENRIKEVSRRKEKERMKVEEQGRVEAMSDSEKKVHFEIQKVEDELRHEEEREKRERGEQSLHELALELQEEEEAIRLLGLKLGVLAKERANEEATPITVEAAEISLRNSAEAETLKAAAIKAFEMKERTEEEQRLLLLAEGVVVTSASSDSMTDMTVFQPIMDKMKVSKSGLRSDSLVALFFTFALIAPIFIDLFKVKG
jgi:hypothetical protein